jgi:hypothetical protein
MAGGPITNEGVDYFIRHIHYRSKIKEAIDKALNAIPLPASEAERQGFAAGLQFAGQMLAIVAENLVLDVATQPKETKPPDRNVPRPLPQPSRNGSTHTTCD